MERKEVLSAMTPAPWAIEEKWRTGTYKIYGPDERSEVGETNTEVDAHAIVSAVNATYGSGIDPEAIPELMHAVLSFIAGMNEEESFPGHSEAYLTQVCLPRAEAAIAKANLKP